MSTRASSSSMRTLGIVLVVLGILAIVAGAIYLAVPADKLPSFFPGHLSSSHAHHTKRGIAGLALGVVLLIVGAITAARRPRVKP